MFHVTDIGEIILTAASIFVAVVGYFLIRQCFRLGSVDCFCAYRVSPVPSVIRFLEKPSYLILPYPSMDGSCRRILGLIYLSCRTRQFGFAVRIAEQSITFIVTANCMKPWSRAQWTNRIMNAPRRTVLPLAPRLDGRGKQRIRRSSMRFYIGAPHHTPCQDPQVLEQVLNYDVCDCAEAKTLPVRPIPRTPLWLALAPIAEERRRQRQ